MHHAARIVTDAVGHVADCFLGHGDRAVDHLHVDGDAAAIHIVDVQPDRALVRFEFWNHLVNATRHAHVVGAVFRDARETFRVLKPHLAGLFLCPGWARLRHLFHQAVAFGVLAL